MGIYEYTPSQTWTYLLLSVKGYDLICIRIRLRAGDVDQWQSAFLEHKRPQVQAPAPHSEEKHVGDSVVLAHLKSSSFPEGAHLICQ